MLLNSRPARYLITRLARAYGFLDPVGLVGRMRGFAQPSEVAEPIELLRAGCPNCPPGRSGRWR